MESIGCSHSTGDMTLVERKIWIAFSSRLWSFRRGTIQGKSRPLRQPWPTAGSSHLSLHSFVLSTPSSRVVLDLIHSVVKRRASCSRDCDQMSMWAFPRTVISQLQRGFVLIQMCRSLRFDEHSVVTFSLCLPAISVPANWGDCCRLRSWGNNAPRKNAITTIILLPYSANYSALDLLGRY